MKRILSFLFVALILAGCSSNRNAVAGEGRGLNPDEVFTITDDDIARETWKINSTLKGEWKYNGPSVGVSGKNVLAGIAKPIAKSKLKKKLKNAFKKVGLDKARPEFVFNEDGTCRIKLLGASMKGTSIRTGNYGKGSGRCRGGSSWRPSLSADSCGPMPASSRTAAATSEAPYLRARLL